MRPSGFLVIAVLALSVPVTASGQAMVPTPIPCERPAPLKTIKSGDSAKIRDAVSKMPISSLRLPASMPTTSAVLRRPA